MAACSQLLPFIPKRDYWYRNPPDLGEFVDVRKRFLGDSRPFCGRSDPIEIHVKASRVSHECATSFESAALGLELDVVVEREMREKGAAGVRRTKLVCTIGPACCSFEDLEKLALRGMNVARLNMSHNRRDWHRDVIKKVKRLNEEKGFCISLMIDTEGSHMHTADLRGTVSVKAEDESIWLFTTKSLDGPLPFTVQANYEGFAEDILLGDELVLDGGMASFEVIEKVGDDLHCKCVDPGLVLPRAKLTFWRNGGLIAMNSALPTLSAKDWDDIEFGISEEVDSIAVSFVKNAEDIRSLKSHLSQRSSESIIVLAKIENLESIRNLREIVQASDGIMVGRGDLGMEVSVEQIPSIQGKITYLCRQLNKPVIVASQLLESMVEYPIPTRAEVADVSEVVRQFADAMMLSEETAIGLFPEKALSVLCTVSEHMEQLYLCEGHQNLFSPCELGQSLPDRIAEEICNSAVEIADSLEVAAIFVYTSNGLMASLLSRNRPNSVVFAFTDKSSTRSWLNLHWGVVPVRVELSDSVEENIKNSFNLSKARGMVREGDMVLVVSDIECASAMNFSQQSIQVRMIA